MVAERSKLTATVKARKPGALGGAECSFASGHKLKGNSTSALCSCPNEYWLAERAVPCWQSSQTGRMLLTCSRIFESFPTKFHIRPLRRALSLAPHSAPFVRPRKRLPVRASCASALRAQLKATASLRAPRRCSSTSAWPSRPHPFSSSFDAFLLFREKLKRHPMAINKLSNLKWASRPLEKKITSFVPRERLHGRPFASVSRLLPLLALLAGSDCCAVGHRVSCGAEKLCSKKGENKAQSLFGR